MRSTLAPLVTSSSEPGSVGITRLIVAWTDLGVAVANPLKVSAVTVLLIAPHSATG